MPTDLPMQLGMIGCGRMGGYIVRRLMRDGHRCVAYDRDPDVVKAMVAYGATGAESLADFVSQAGQATEHLDHGAGRRGRRDSGATAAAS